MSEHRSASFERHCDVAIIGASAAGLAAALQIGRQRRSVIMIDAGEPRNAPATHMHGFIGRDGTAASELLDDGRAEVRSYGVEVLDGCATAVRRSADERFTVELTGGIAVVARRVLVATGLVDDLPDIDGIRRHWGGDVVHCPFCHGFEIRDRRIVAIVDHELGLHPAVLWHRLTDRFTVVVHDGLAADHPGLVRLRAARIPVVDGPVRRLVDDADGQLVAVETGDETRLAADVVAVVPRFRARAEMLEPLGLGPEAHPSGLGSALTVGPTGETAVAGLYAAGNVTDPTQQVLQAAASGSLTGAMIALDLAEADVDAAHGGRTAPNEADWDHRYGGEPIWSGDPNGSLVAEVADLEPGAALDVGAGEGGDAIWLAEQGWRVTANDVSERALDRLGAEAERRGLDVERSHADANGCRPFPSGAFDLVTAHYASIPRTPDDRAVHHLLDAVAPGGTLLVVGHDTEPMRQPIDPHEHSRAFDPDAFVRVDDVAAALDRADGWEVAVHELRTRPEGAASHHTVDVVLRATRVALVASTPAAARRALRLAR